MSIKAKIFSVVLSVLTVFALSGAAFATPVAQAQTVAELQAQIAALLATINALQAQLAAMTGGGSSGSGAPCTPPAPSLTLGSTGSGVACVQKLLNAWGFQVAASGAGSPGSESTYFGTLTKAALAKYQAARGISPAVGYYGPVTASRFNTDAAGMGGTTPPPPPPPPPGGGGSTGSGLMVSLAANQPAVGMFGENFSNRPFTVLSLTAGSDGDVVVNSMTVERTGVGADAAFSGVVALDENGLRITDEKTFNSNHTLTLSNKFTVKAGQTRTITLAGNSDSDQNDYNGQNVSLTLKAVDGGTGVTVTGIPSMGLTGTTMTVNSTLTIGSFTVIRGTTDPGSSQTKEAGTVGYTFSALRGTAGSAEAVRIKGVRWYNTGSVASSDLANLKVIVGTTEYPAVASSDGKYYSAALGSGVLVDKGAAIEIAIKGDIISGSNRSVDMDVNDIDDIVVVGETYGFGISPTFTNSGDSSTDDDGTLQTANPQYDAYEVTVGAGSVIIENATEVPSQNIAIGVSDQPVGGFKITVKGEPVTVTQMVFRIAESTGDNATANTQDLTSVKLVRDDGITVAGPVDIAANSLYDQSTLTFSDTVEFPVGTHVYTLKGKVGTDYGNNDTIVASTTPNSDWSNPKGSVTNQSITLTSSTITSQTMTVKAGALVVATLPTPVAQTIVAGVSGYNFANFAFDTTSSGEDLRLNSTQVEFNFGQAASNDDLTVCQLWDGAVALNTGTNVVNGANTDTTGDDKTFTFDTSWIIPKGTVKTLALKCNTSATTTTTNSTTYNWTIEIPDEADNMVPVGAVSGSTITETYSDETGQAITLSGSGSFTVVKDDSTSAATNTPVLAIAGTTDNVVNAFKFTGSNEAVNLSQIILTLDDAAGSSTPSDLKKVTLWDGSTKVGEAIFSTEFATVTVSGFTIPKDADKVMTVKADFESIGTSQAARPGHQVRVEYAGWVTDGTNNGTKGIGASSGQTIYSGTRAVTASGGARIFKAVPTFAAVALPTYTLVNGPASLYRFSITAPSGGNGVGLYQFSFYIATSTSGVTTYAITNLEVKGYSDSGFTQTTYANNGLLNGSGLTTGYPLGLSNIYKFKFNPTNPTGTTPEAVQVPAGTTRYFELTGSVANMSATSSTVTVGLLGDASYFPTDNGTADTWTGLYKFATSAINVASSTIDTAYWNFTANQSDFIWSGNSTTTSGIGHFDWSNGYQVPGLNSGTSTLRTLTP